MNCHEKLFKLAQLICHATLYRVTWLRQAMQKLFYTHCRVWHVNFPQVLAYRAYSRNACDICACFAVCLSLDNTRSDATTCICYRAAAGAAVCPRTYQALQSVLDRPFEFARVTPWNAPSMVGFAGVNPCRSHWLCRDQGVILVGSAGAVQP